MAKKEKDPPPLTRPQLRMVTEFRKYRDIYKGAEHARIPKNQAIKTFNLPEFQAELERQDEAVRLERARQQVKAEKLTNELIDSSLVEVMVLDPKEHGSLKMDAIRTALVVNGRIQHGAMRSLELLPHGGGDDPNSDATPRPAHFYQALVQVSEAPTPILPVTAAQPPSVPEPPTPTTPAGAAPKIKSRLGSIKVG